MAALARGSGYFDKPISNGPSLRPFETVTACSGVESALNPKHAFKTDHMNGR